MNILPQYKPLLLPLKSPYCSLPVVVTVEVKNWNMRKTCYWYLFGVYRLVLFNDDTTLNSFKNKHPLFSLRVDGVRYTAIDRDDVLNWLHRFGYNITDRIGAYGKTK